VAVQTVIPSAAAVKNFIGKPLGPSDWVEITQDRVDRFADATDDHQWIHVDPERARKESPFGAAVAHGYLTLSLAPALLGQILRVEGEPTVLNTGITKMKLSAPVLVGSRVRLHAEIAQAREMPGGSLRAVFDIKIETEGAEKPALRAGIALVYVAESGPAD
jgi:acyl dehydratase